MTATLPALPNSRPRPHTAGQSSLFVEKPIRFKGSLLGSVLTPANAAVGWLNRNLYDRGEGVRYVVEQTLGYTVPRTVQQLNRTKHVTGESNPLAAMEMLIRDLAADFADTFLPGLLATFAIGSWLDKSHNTLVRRNFGSNALSFYESLLQREPAATGEANWANRSQFFEALETRLKEYAGSVNPGSAQTPLELERLITEIPNAKSLENTAITLAERLGLSDLDLTLVNASKKMEITVPDLVQDLWHLVQKNPKITSAPRWGEEMAGLLAKTHRLARYQMIGNGVALAASISIPFGIRMLTRWIYGEDAFPGTKELEKHLKSPAPQPTQAQPHKPKGKFVLFPYLSETLKEGNWLPTALTAGFFGVLAAAVGRRFSLQGLSVLRAKDWVKVYEFGRHFPFTTIEQMELTYGLLCGFRLASSRDRAEFRESGIRDCLLGWPTLTYFFPFFRKNLSRVFNGTLAQKFGQNNLLLKPNGEVRKGMEITENFFKNLGVRDENVLKGALKQTKLTQDWVTILSAAVSWVLLAFAEPKLGIWLTNKLEVDRMEKEAAAAKPHTPPVFFDGQSLRNRGFAGAPRVFDIFQAQLQGANRFSMN